MKYNWQHEDWPNLTYNPDELVKVIDAYKKKAYGFQGRLHQLNKESQAEAHINLMVEEAISTSAIEGEILNREEVRSSVSRFLGISLTKQKGYFPKEDGISEMLINVRESINSNLSKEKICHWHKSLLHGSDGHYPKPIVKGEYRDGDVQIVKGDLYGNEEVIFEGPGENRAQVTAEMDKFIEWYNETSPLNENGINIPGPAKAAIAHLWFVSIHPFEDGNGRIARAIAEHALFQDFDSPPLFSISMAINDDRGDYYKQLASTNESMDVSKWVKWFAEKVEISQDLSIKKVDFILKKAKFWDKFKDTGLNERQSKVVDKVFQNGIDGFIKDGISNEKYRAITGCTHSTATRDLKDLVEKNMFVISGTGKRNLRYEINLAEEASVFSLKNTGNVTKSGNRDRFIQNTLDKMLITIERNIDFHQDITNPKLLALIESFNELAEGNDQYKGKLKGLLSINDNDMSI